MEYTSDPDWPKDEEFQRFAARNIIHSYAQADGSQKIDDDGPCPPERMRTRDDEVNKHAKNFIRKAVSEDKPFFVWHCPARAHVWTYFSEKYQKELGKDGKGMQEVVM